MKIRFQTSFNKQFTKLSHDQKLLVRGTIELFSDDPYSNGQRNHPLKNEWKGYHSISVDTDLRLHAKILDDDTALFVAKGTLFRHIPETCDYWFLQPISITRPEFI